MGLTMNATLDEIYEKFLNVEETIQALVITSDILKEHYDRDDEREIYHLMLGIHKNVESVGQEMKEALRDLDKFLVSYQEKRC